MKNKVFVVGSLNYDVCLVQQRFPEEGETCLADSVTYCSGGKGANQAVQAAKLGLETYMIGCIGNDTQGVFLKSEIEKYGVHTDFLREIKGNSGMSVAQSLGKGDVRASIVGGANLCVSTKDIDRAFETVNKGDYLVLQLEIPIPTVEYAIMKGREKGCVILINAAPALPISSDALKKTDYFIVNEVEAKSYSGMEINSKEDAYKVCSYLKKEYENTCIITLGKLGSVIGSGSEFKLIPALSVAAVESTGAGDSFIGGLCYSLICGKNIFEAAEFATKCSAHTVCRVGGQPAMPNLYDLSED